MGVLMQDLAERLRSFFSSFIEWVWPPFWSMKLTALISGISNVICFDSIIQSIIKSDAGRLGNNISTELRSIRSLYKSLLDYLLLYTYIRFYFG